MSASEKAGAPDELVRLTSMAKVTVTETALRAESLPFTAGCVHRNGRTPHDSASHMVS